MKADFVRSLLQTEKYLAALPGGWNAYPQCQQKAAVYRTIIEGLSLQGTIAELPEPVQALLLQPPPVTAWLSEVQVTALYLALRDLLYDNDATYLELHLERNRALLRGPLYRLLFRVLSPAVLLRGGQQRWEQLHKGTQAVIREVAPGMGCSNSDSHRITFLNYWRVATQQR